MSLALKKVGEVQKMLDEKDKVSTKKIIDNIKEGKPNIIGSQKGRRSSENA